MNSPFCFMRKILALHQILIVKMLWDFFSGDWKSIAAHKSRSLWSFCFENSRTSFLNFSLLVKVYPHFSSCSRIWSVISSGVSRFGNQVSSSFCGWVGSSLVSIAFVVSDFVLAFPLLDVFSSLMISIPSWSIRSRIFPSSWGLMIVFSSER